MKYTKTNIIPKDFPFYTYYTDGFREIIFCVTTDKYFSVESNCGDYASSHNFKTPEEYLTYNSKDVLIDYLTERS